MANHYKLYFRSLIPAAKRWWRDRHADDAAALAFYSLISLVPILISSVWLASLVVEEEAAKRVIVEETGRIAGSSVGQYIAKILSSDIKFAGSSFSPILATGLILFSATKMLSELRESLTKIFGKSPSETKIFRSILSRFVAFSMVLSLGFIILSAVAVETVIHLLINALPDASWLRSIFSYLTPTTTFIGVIVLATLTMRLLPEARPKMKPAIAGSCVCAILLICLKVGFYSILKHSDFGSYYGSAFTLVLVLFWVYFSMQAFLFGAEYAAELNTRKKNVRARRTRSGR